jgi:hypothetical protein
MKLHRFVRLGVLFLVFAFVLVSVGALAQTQQSGAGASTADTKGAAGNPVAGGSAGAGGTTGLSTTTILGVAAAVAVVGGAIALGAGGDGGGVTAGHNQ